MEKVELSSFTNIPPIEEQYALDFMEHNGAIQLEKDDDLIKIGLTAEDNAKLQLELKKFHKKEVVFYKIEKSDLLAYLGKISSQFDNASYLSAASGTAISIDKLANDAPVVNLVNSLLIEGIKKGASDIHIEGFQDTVVVRYRIDGVLQRVLQLKAEQFAAISARIKIMANLNIMEKRLPQDGRITLAIDNNSYDLRASILPISHGESIVLRLFNRQDSPISLDAIGFLPKDIETLRRLYQIPNGLILATGPTGSGKTTTLSAILRELRDESRKIISIEDPIENVLEEVSQIQTHDKIGLTFHSILRRVLRQDPNIIMVGEIRDKETAELAARAALTGHLVLSTLHTNDAVSVINRLINMGLPAYLIAAVLRGAIAQRLVRRLCDHCKKKVSLTDIEKTLAQKYGVKLTSKYKPTGCEKCNNTGYKGRIAILELFHTDEEIEHMIAKESTTTELFQTITAKNMTTLQKDSLEKIKMGFTTFAEVEQAVVL